MTERIDIWVESAWLGHVTRQLNLIGHLLARADMRGLEVRFLVDDNSATQEAIVRTGHPFVVRAPDIGAAFVQLAHEWRASPPRIFVLDSVNHDKHAAANAVLSDPRVYTVVIIDDPDDRDVNCDLLINALPGGTPDRATMAGRYLRGTQYLILPPEYATIREAYPNREIAGWRLGFAFFGGGDPKDIGSIFLDMVGSNSIVPEWRMLLGPRYSHSASAINRVKGEGLPVRIFRYVESMAQTLREADVAVLAAGNTLSEAAAVGTPVIAFSQNAVQKENARFFAGICGIIDLGLPAADSSERLAANLKHLAENREERLAMTNAMMSTVDALGGRRVAEMIAGGVKNRLQN